MECPKCAGNMEEGFLADTSQAAIIQQQWYPGRPEKSFWTVTKVERGRLLKVTTFRCTSCGYLESYANE